MNRKHNPWVALVALLLLVGIVVFSVGCAATETEAAAPKAPDRFTVEAGAVTWYGNLYIITDNETGVQYLAYRCGEGVGLTRLEAE